MKTLLSPKQLEAFRWMGSDEKMLFLCGAVRSGKSFIMDLAWLIWTQGAFETPQQFIMGGFSVSAIRRNVFPDMMKLADYLGIGWQYIHQGSLVKCGKHEYHLFGASDADSVDKVRGMTAAGAYMDEIVLMNPDFVAMVITRLSVPGAKLIASCNPAAPGHYIKREYVDEVENMNSSYMQFGLNDNPSLTDEYKDTIKQTLKGADYQRLIEGEWVAKSGLCYPRYVVGKADFKPKVWYVLIDYSTSGTVAMLLAGKKGTRTHIFAEHYHTATGRSEITMQTSSQKTDEELGDDLEEFILDNGLERDKVSIIPDPSAASFKRTMQQRGFQVLNAQNEILDGIRITNSALDAGLVTIDKRCKKLAIELDTYLWDEKAAEKGEDKPLKTDKHHGVDALRYYCYKLYYWLNGAVAGPIAKPEGM